MFKLIENEHNLIVDYSLGMLKIEGSSTYAPDVWSDHTAFMIETRVCPKKVNVVKCILESKCLTLITLLPPIQHFWSIN